MATQGRFKVSAGDWLCSDPDCGNINFARRLVCNRCKKDKPFEKTSSLGSEIGTDAAKKSKGLFSAEDWQCTKCGNINWARRSTCNVCNAPKVGDVEERTGYGGGYNERGEVDYIHRDESDGEYDEFGRKKKKYRGESSKAQSTEDGQEESASKNIKVEEKVKESLVKEEKKEEEEEEEEKEDDDDDDEDDGDVSKYDLSGWGDDNEEEEEDGDKSEESTSRSRSKDASQDVKERARSRSPIQRSSD